jgi:parallel beta-helix repeat protein
VGVGAGISVSTSDCQIEDNKCTGNDYGIRVTSANNFISRNICSDNTTLNWDVVANNRCLVVQAVNSTAIFGNSGGTAPGSTNPWVNYTY